MFRFRSNEFVFQVRKERILLVQSAIIFVVTSMALYLFLWCVREIMRFGSHWWVDLNATELYLYNWLFAAVSCVWGIQAGMAHALQHTSTKFLDPVKRKTRRAITEQRASIWYFLHWFLKLGSFIVMFFAFSNFGLYYSLASDHLFLIFLIPVVLYFGLWPQLNQILKRWSQKLMIYGFMVLILYSSALATVNLYTTDEFAENIKKRNVHYQYDLTIPESPVAKRISDRNYFDVFVCGRKSDPSKETKFVVGPPWQPARELGYNGLLEYLEAESYSSYGYSLPPTLILHIDKDTDMNTVREILHLSRMVNVIKVMYNAKPTELALHVEDPEVDAYGIFHIVRPFVNQNVPIELIPGFGIDSMYPPPPPAPPGYGYWLCDYSETCFIKDYRNIARVWKSDEDKLLVDDIEVSLSSLEDVIVSHIHHYPDSFIFWMDLHDERTFEEYIALKSVFISSFKKLRGEYSIREFGYDFESNYLTKEQRKAVRKKYPMRIWETSLEEARLQDYKREKYGVN